MEKQQPSEAEIEDAKIESLRENAEILREIAGALRMFAEARDSGAGELRDVLQRHGDGKVQDALLGAANVLDYWHRRALIDARSERWRAESSASGED